MTYDEIMNNLKKVKVVRVDHNVGLANLVNFMISGNANVGQVTVAHGLGVEAVVRCNRIIDMINCGHEDEAHDYLEKLAKT